MIDIAITATIRPDVLQKTLSSFYCYCFTNYSYISKCENIHIVLNVDPIGDTNKYNQQDVLNTCYNFSKNITFNFPKKASFPKAVKWVWKNCKSEFVFHLEDDWELKRNVDLLKIINYFDRTDLSAIRLYKKKYPSKEPYMMFDCEYLFDGNELFIALDSGTQFGLNPSLIKRSFIKEALPLMVDDLNPEKQFRIKNIKMKDFILNHKYGIFGVPGDIALVNDIGTDWRIKRDIAKSIGSSFLTWV